MKDFSKIIVFLAILFTAISANAQKGSSFPSLEGETLTNKILTIPTDTKDKFTLVGMAWSKKSEEALKSWFIPIYQTFIYKPTKPVLFASEYDVNVFFVPMFTGVKKAAYKTVMKKMKSKTDPKLVPHILFYKGELKKFKEKLAFSKKDTPYFFVLDTDGKIVYSASGKYSDEKLEEIEAVLEE